MTTRTLSKPDFTKAYPGGVLSIAALSDRAFRVRFAPRGQDGTMPESRILVDGLPTVAASVSGNDGNTCLTLPHLTCEVTETTGRLRFFGSDGTLLLSETEAGRRLAADKLGGETIHIARQAFDSPTDERLYGTGCFQDGALDLRGLPRRLTQVNTQISLPSCCPAKATDCSGTIAAAASSTRRRTASLS